MTRTTIIGFLICMALAASACKTTTAPVKEGSMTAVKDVVPKPGPFEVATAWMSKPDPASQPVTALVQAWEHPWVERMHRNGPGYAALILGDAKGPEGVLLQLKSVDGAWKVVGAAIVASDYLWPKH